MKITSRKLSFGLVTLSLLTATQLHGADLIQFQAGQSAKAAEVNANFKALNDELASLKNFEQLSAEQLTKLRAAVGVAGSELVVNVDCTTNPAALQQEWQTIGERTNWVNFKIKGACYANLQRQYHNFTLMIDGTEENRASKLIADPAASVGTGSITGTFNGGLYLNNLTIDAPSNTPGVLFSRSAEGNLNEVTINGGSIGVQLQANAQAYMSNVNIIDPSLQGIRVATGASLRLFGNGNGTPLVQMQNGTALSVDQAHVNAGSTTKLNAPTTLNLSGNAATYFQSLEANGDIRLSSAAQLYAQNIKAIGNVYLYMNSAMQANSTDILGAVSASQGSNVVFSKGTLQATAPNSDNYNDKLVLNVQNGSSAFIGGYGDSNQINVVGHVNLSQGQLWAERASLNSTVFAEASAFDVRHSSLSSGDEYPLTVASSSSMIFRNSASTYQNMNLHTNASLYCHESSFGEVNLNLTAGAALKSENCSASGNLGLRSGGQADLHQSNFGDMTASLDHNSTLSLNSNSQLGIFHARSNSDVTLWQSQITGNVAMSFGDDSIFIDSSSSVAIDNSSIQGIPVLNNHGVVRFQNNASTSGLILNCSNRAGVDYWMTNDQKTALIAGLAQYNCANNE